MRFVPRRMLLIPLAVLNTGAVTALWTLAAAGISDRATDVLSSAAVAATAVSGTAWIALGAAFMRHNRELEQIVTAAVEARRRAGDGVPGHLRRIQ